MQPHAHQNQVAMVLLGAAALLLASCAGNKYVAVDHRAFEKTPNNGASKFWRAMSGLPVIKKNSRYGLWGGSGNLGGKPIDKMDEGFRRHDLVYYESRCGEHLKAADRELIEWLEDIDIDSLDAKGRKYHKTALKFMNSPFVNFVGKSPVVMLHKNEKREDCYFQSPEMVSNFFNPNHSGFPYPEAPKPEPAPAPLIASSPEETTVDFPVVATAQ